MNPLPHTAPTSGPDSLELHVPTGGLVGLALKVHLAQARGVPCRWEEKSMHATRSSSFTPVPHDSLHVRVGLGAHTAAPRPPLLGSEERRCQKTHRPSGAPHADRCADELHGSDVRRRLEARHGSCCHTVLRVLLLLPDFVDPKPISEGRNDVPVPLVLTGKALHQGEPAARELADLPAGRDVKEAHRVVGAGADDLCAVVAERYPVHDARVPRQRVHLRTTSHSESVNA